MNSFKAKGHKQTRWMVGWESAWDGIVSRFVEMSAVFYDVGDCVSFQTGLERTDNGPVTWLIEIVIVKQTNKI